MNAMYSRNSVGDKNGNSRTAFEIRVSNTQFIGSKKEQGESVTDPMMQFAQNNPEFVAVADDSDLPF